MARLPYADIDRPEYAATVARVKRDRGDHVGNIYRMMLHSPPALNGWLEFFNAVRSQGELGARPRELAILRVAVLNGAEYEFAAHAPIAQAAGVSQAQLDALKRGETPADLPEADRAVLDYTEAMTRSVQVPDAVFAAVRRHFNERLMVELTLTIGGYNLVSRFLVALQIDPEAGKYPEVRK